MSSPKTGDIQFDGGRGLLEEGRIGDWMQTWTGRRFYVADPRPEDVDPLDCIMALAMKSRYNGHCRFYSCVEHSIHVNRMVPLEYAREGFGHDFDEVYMPDLHRPAKRVLGKENAFFKLCENIYKKAIAPRFNLPLELSSIVKEADTAICIVEREALHPRADEWYLPFPRPNIEIQAYGPEAAFWAGLQRYCELFNDDFEKLSGRARELMAQDQDALISHWNRCE